MPGHGTVGPACRLSARQQRAVVAACAQRSFRTYDEARTWRFSRPLSDAPLPDWPALGNASVAEGGYSSMATTSGGIKADSGAFLTGRHLTSGGEAATGTLRVTNDSRGAALISFRALAGDSPLARQMHIELSLDGKKLAGGSLTEMSRWTGKLPLTRGSSRTLDASAWIPGSVREGYEGKTADINLQVRGKVVSR